MAGNDVFLFSVPSDASKNDVRLRDPTTVAPAVDNGEINLSSTMFDDTSYSVDVDIDMFDFSGIQISPLEDTAVAADDTIVSVVFSDQVLDDDFDWAPEWPQGPPLDQVDDYVNVVIGDILFEDEDIADTVLLSPLDDAPVATEDSILSIVQSDILFEDDLQDDGFWSSPLEDTPVVDASILSVSISDVIFEDEDQLDGFASGPLDQTDEYNRVFDTDILFEDEDLVEGFISGPLEDAPVVDTSILGRSIEDPIFEEEEFDGTIILVGLDAVVVAPTLVTLTGFDIFVSPLPPCPIQAVAWSYVQDNTNVWAPVSEPSQTWTGVSKPSLSWTEVLNTSLTYTPVTKPSQAWSVVSDTSLTWSEIIQTSLSWNLVTEPSMSWTTVLKPIFLWTGISDNIQTWTELPDLNLNWSQVC